MTLYNIDNMAQITIFVQVMLFYALLTFIIGPMIGYYSFGDLESAGNGYVIGSILSLILWYLVGSQLVEDAKDTTQEIIQ